MKGLPVGAKPITNLSSFLYRTDFSEYGCILEIREVQYFPDGRSLVDCVGGKRFKVLSRGQRDGYSTARVQFLEDNHPEGQELEGKYIDPNKLTFLSVTLGLFSYSSF